MTSESISATSLPLVSVIIPAYNYARFISHAIESVQAQTYAAWECIVIDDGSIDGTGEVVEEFARRDARIKYFYQKNKGLSAARNAGIKNSSGAYLQFLDADDLIEAHKIAHQVEYLEQHKDVDIVYSAARYFNDDAIGKRRYSMHKTDRTWMPQASGDGKRILDFLARGNIMAVNCPLLRKSVVDEIGFFDERMRALEDWDYWIRCATAGKHFQFSDAGDTRALVRSHPQSLSKSNETMIAAALRLQDKLRIAKIAPDVAMLYRKLNAHLEAFLGIEETKRGNRLRGARRLFKAGAMNKKLKLFAYALAALFVSRQQFERIIAISISQFVAGLRQTSTKLFS
jgi:glycosyltransferase involved in cell wall biosynthesis